ncbi:hypothetical protein [uncultured Sphingomonas sp.]|uniref:hypothetical protein n=1 Tax=uncultured Sphingomonas sp. TaxID=158754 RepID=UPI0025EA2A8F|nr:hypothetical protein [uncultured Sphingomonas sp.]
MPGSLTAAGSTLAISAASPATQDATGYTALTYTEIGGIEKIGTYGATFAKVEFQPLKGGKQKHKGAPDYGALQPSLAIDSGDAGQTLMQTASDDQTAQFAFRITLPDGAKRFFQGRVFGMPETVDGADSVVTAAPTIEINTKPVRVAGT